MTLTITSTVIAHSATLRVTGDLDYGHADRLLDTVSRLLTGRSPLQTLRIDCSGVSYCDSAGLAAFLQIHRNSSAAGIQLYLDARPGFLDRILEIAGVLTYLTTDPNDAQLDPPLAPRWSGRDDSDASAEDVGN